MVLVNKTNTIEVSQALKKHLRMFICNGVDFCVDEISAKNWTMRITDSNEIFDGDEIALSNAMKYMGCEKFYIMPIVWIIYEKIDSNSYINVEDVAYVFDSTCESIIEFQKPDWEYLNFDTCLFFDENFSFLVIRTGNAEHVLYAGSPEFINIACSANDWWWPYPQERGLS